jgi:hypothetical protein
VWIEPVDQDSSSSSSSSSNSPSSLTKEGGPFGWGGARDFSRVSKSHSRPPLHRFPL